MKSFYESRRSCWQFIIQVRVAASHTQCSGDVKCTNVLHSRCATFTVQGQQTLGCPRLCPLLLQIVYFYRLILERRREKREQVEKDRQEEDKALQRTC